MKWTIKTSAILISSGQRTSVYRSVDEVPPELRDKLAQSTSGENARTVLMADRRGAQELLRANIKALIEERFERPSIWPSLRAYWWPFAIPLLTGLLLWAVLR
jgi:hypothetical protein